MMRPGRILHVHVSSRAHISKGSVAYRFSLQERRIGELGREMTWARDRAREAGGGGGGGSKNRFSTFSPARSLAHIISRPSSPIRLSCRLISILPTRNVNCTFGCLERNVKLTFLVSKIDMWSFLPPFSILRDHWGFFIKRKLCFGCRQS